MPKQAKLRAYRPGKFLAGRYPRACRYVNLCGTFSASSVVITLRVSPLGFRAFRRFPRLDNPYNHSIAMKQESGRKTAITVGMLIGLPHSPLIHLEADAAFCQVPALAE